MGREGGTQLGQLLIVINVLILPQRTQKPDSAEKKNVAGNIWGALTLISSLGLVKKIKSFLLRFLWQSLQFFSI